MIDVGSISRVIAERSLKWLLCSREPLDYQDFIAAVSYGLSNTVGALDKDDILRICTNFIAFDEILERFQFAHLSVAEFLMGHCHFQPELNHYLVAETCLEFCMKSLDRYYLRVRDGANSGFWNKETEGKPYTPNRFEVYSMLFWAYHCKEAGDLLLKGSLHQSFQQFLSPTARQNTESSSFNKWNFTVRTMALRLFPPRISDQTWTDAKSMTSYHRADSLIVGCKWGLLYIVQVRLMEIRRTKTRGSPDAAGAMSWSTESRNCHGNTYLQIASIYGHCEIVQVLIDNGADVNAVHPESSMTSLHLACSNAQQPIVELLLDNNAKVQSPDKDGMTALHYAAEAGIDGIVRLLLQKPVKLNQTGQMGWTPLHYAADRGHLTIVQQLVEKGCSINAFDSSGCTPLYHAVGRGHEAVVRFLLEQKAATEAKEEFGKTGKSPLHVAIQWRRESIARLLLAAGANTKAKTASGWTVTHYARLADPKMMQFLLDQGVSMETTDPIPLKGILKKKAEAHELGEDSQSLMSTQSDGSRLRRFMTHLRRKDDY